MGVGYSGEEDTVIISPSSLSSLSMSTSLRRNTKGFTLIELLIVVVIIGILAAVAIPKFASTKQNAYLAAMKTDLRNLITAEEGYASNNPGTYLAGTATNASPLGPTSIKYAPSPNVTVTVTTSGAGWSATAAHSQVSGKTCGVYVNLAAAPGGTNPATVEGTPACN
jgi:type IV pilus assembly protein PilA